MAEVAEQGPRVQPWKPLRGQCKLLDTQEGHLPELQEESHACRDQGPLCVGFCEVRWAGQVRG